MVVKNIMYNSYRKYAGRTLGRKKILWHISGKYPLHLPKIACSYAMLWASSKIRRI